MNSSSFSCAWRSAEAECGLMRVMLTPNWVRPTASPMRCFSRPEMTAANSFGYDGIGCAGILPTSIFGMASHPLDDRCGAHAGADAQRDQSGRSVAPFQFIEHGAENHRAGRAQRMPHGDRA